MHTSRIPRQRVLKGAKIIFNNGSSVIDCMARNVSAGGAALDIVSTDGVPAEFALAIGDLPPRPCRIAWRRSGRIGVRFI